MPVSMSHLSHNHRTGPTLAIDTITIRSVSALNVKPWFEEATRIFKFIQDAEFVKKSPDESFVVTVVAPERSYNVPWADAVHLSWDLVRNASDDFCI